MIALPSDPKKLNETNNMLTDFLDFLTASDSGSGIFMFNHFPRYDLNGKLVEATQFERPDKEDVADCLEALGMLSDRNKRANREEFLYTHGVEKDEVMLPVIFNITVLTHQGKYGALLKRIDF